MQMHLKGASAGGSFVIHPESGLPVLRILPSGHIILKSRHRGVKVTSKIDVTKLMRIVLDVN